MKFRLFLKSFDKKLINYASKELEAYCSKNSIKIISKIALPIKRKRFCVLRSPHIDKDSREHFELQFHKHFMDIEVNSPKILDILLKVNLPGGLSYFIEQLSS